MRFLAQQHIRRTSDFQQVRSLGRRVDCGPFLMQFYVRDPESSLRRVGVIASKRVGNAVERNRAKRLMRELFRNHQDQLPRGVDVVMIARRAILRFSYKTLIPRFLKPFRKDQSV